MNKLVAMIVLAVCCAFFAVKSVWLLRYNLTRESWVALWEAIAFQVAAVLILVDIRKEKEASRKQLQKRRLGRGRTQKIE